jgi:hypothetical protein
MAVIAVISHRFRNFGVFFFLSAFPSRDTALCGDCLPGAEPLACGGTVGDYIAASV